MELENVKEIAVELTSEVPHEDNDKTLIKKWLEPVLSWERDNMSVKALKNGWAIISTSVPDWSGCPICIYVRDEGDRITMSDYGYFIEIYCPSFEEMSKEEKEKLKYAIRFASLYGIHRVGDELVMETTKEHYASDFHIFLDRLVWFSNYLE